MAVDTAVDAELWLILAAMLVLGCFLTARTVTTRRGNRGGTSRA